MKYHARIVSLVAALAASAAVMPAQAQQPAAAVKLGIVTFLTGPAATPFGIPSRNAAEIVIETLNAGKAPAPFDNRRPERYEQQRDRRQDRPRGH